MKATHFGTCQLCGREQKLPGGRLSIHGYTVEWSMFIGTCPGTHGKPFEEAYDLIEAAIGRAEQTIEGLKKAADALDADENPDHVWIYEYQKATWARGRRHGGYQWRWIPVADIAIAEVDTSGGYKLYQGTYKQLDGTMSRSQSLFGGAGYTRDVTKAYREMNATKAAHYRREIPEYERYIKWQTERIAAWKPQALKPVEKG